MFKKLQNCLPALALLALLGVFFAGVANAQTDITSVVDSIDGYWTAAKAIAIGILLFVLGRRVVRKI